MNTNPKPFTLDRVVRMLIGLFVVVLLFLLINKLRGVLLPFLIAWLLAYLLQPFVGFFQYKLKFKNRMLSIFATLLLFFGSLTALVLILAPIVSLELQKLSQSIVIYTQTIDVNTFIPVAWQTEIKHYLEQLKFQSVLKDQNIMDGLKKLAPQLWDLVNGSIDFFF